MTTSSSTIGRRARRLAMASHGRPFPCGSVAILRARRATRRRCDRVAIPYAGVRFRFRVDGYSCGAPGLSRSWLSDALEQRGAEVALAGVGQNRHDGLARVFGSPGEASGYGDRCAGRNPGQDPFFVGEAARMLKGFLVGDPARPGRPVNRILGTNPAPIPLDLMP
jgi:hypothetical protein